MAQQRLAGAPAAVLEAALQNFVQGAAQQTTGFVPTASFVAEKPGFYFSAGPQGTGQVDVSCSASSWHKI